MTTFSRPKDQSCVRESDAWLARHGNGMDRIAKPISPAISAAHHKRQAISQRANTSTKSGFVASSRKSK